MVKLSQDEFRLHKNNIKFIEHYWAAYKQLNRRYQKYEHANQIRKFIKGDKYEELIQVKYNRLSHTYSLSRRQYREFLAYSNISQDLKKELARFTQRR